MHAISRLIILIVNSFILIHLTDMICTILHKLLLSAVAVVTLYYEECNQIPLVSSPLHVFGNALTFLILSVNQTPGDLSH